MLNATELPQPEEAALAHSAALVAKIRAAIARENGSIGFEQFMQMALYEPGLGYYLGGARKFGTDGDFVTAPELSDLFGHCLAHQAAPLLAQLGSSIFEFGAGSGALAASVLNALGARGLTPSYQILELSPELRQRQEDKLMRLAPAHIERVRWVQDLESGPFNGVVFANEIVDAFPVASFKKDGDKVFERRVALSYDDTFTWLDSPASASLRATIQQCLESTRFLADDVFVSEINTGVGPWIADLSRFMGEAVALLVDYGFPRHEYYHLERSHGTLLCHFRHRAHNDPFYYPGLQDITASVDFTRVAEVASDNGLSVLGYTEQANFLLANGLLDAASKATAAADERKRQRIAYETKVLTLPNEMGARFKVLALAKGYTAPLSGFQLRDERHRL